MRIFGERAVRHASIMDELDYKEFTREMIDLHNREVDPYSSDGKRLTYLGELLEIYDELHPS